MLKISDNNGNNNADKNWRAVELAWITIACRRKSKIVWNVSRRLTFQTKSHTKKHKGKKDFRFKAFASLVETDFLGKTIIMTMQYLIVCLSAGTALNLF